MSQPICIVSATRKSKEDFWKGTPLAYSLLKQRLGIDYHIYYQNTDGLPLVYNRAIEKLGDQYPYLVLVHDDVLIEDLFLDDKLEQALQIYDIVGLAGSKEMNLNAEVLAWHLMSPKEQHCGEVAHSKDTKFWTSIFGSTSSPVLCLDGLFLAVSVKKLREQQVSFDPLFNFHHYDLDFCATAHQKGLKMGVVPIKVTHFGLGDSMNTEAWKSSSDLFRKKWNHKS